ncbi:MAG: cytochrome c3 family protein [Betaproteobacteria bacterium]
MKNIFLSAVLCGALTLISLPVSAAEKLPPVPASAKTKSMAEKGSYHRIHEQKEKLECEDCHQSKPLPDDTLKLRLHEPLAKKSPGPVTAEACHECHGKEQKKTVTWYAPKVVAKK